MSVFFDTNILVYMFDEDAPGKKALCQELFQKETRASNALLSTQVLQEFYVSVTRKFAVPLPSETAEEVVRYLSFFPIVRIDETLVLNAIGKSRLYGFSFWDALIITSALAGDAEILYTEDLQHGQVIDTLRIENPFI